ncbi:pectate lyase superfamily protein-domain-containing protein [Cercophora newfieldiana]|uniref:Pectate lyase superfamily protein-domain-containing protein n=1 Tax=Cercophora newfieldiana TaxID=92897 RepID=A0AA39YNM9_9PEZI|nr:pectate lyase superfamily protein-domain-containing protein [Cercophora newfieldiana]
MKVLSLLLVAASAARAAFWLEDIRHHGISPFNPDKSYTVFRNVRDFGAKVTDDTAAINAAISAGNRCMAYECVGTTTTPAVVYIPAGTYLISSSIVDYYYTQIIGDPTNMPVIKGTGSFKSPTIGLLEGNKYMDNGRLSFVSTNVFFRQVRNLVFDTTDVPGEIAAIHWPSSQATSIQNCMFKLSTRSEDTHTGIFMEEGSGGLLTDLIFVGGKYGAQFGNQQYTMRNLTFINAETAILQIWNWGWTYKSINIIDCQVGINMSSESVGSAILLDSQFINVPVAVVTGHDPSNSTSRGSLVVENVMYTHVPIVLQASNGQTLLLGDPVGVVYDGGYATGNLYAPHGPTPMQGRDESYFRKPSTLKLDYVYYERSKPQYESFPASAFLSAREHGAAGDGVTDDTASLNALFKAVSEANFSSVAFLDAGYYLVTDTVYVPAGALIVGEPLAAVIMGAGAKFSDMNNPHPVVMIGMPGEVGLIEMSDVIVSTKGAAAGALLIQYNLNTPAGAKTCEADLPPSGLWDVHTRIGGFAGSDLQVAHCPITPHVPNHIDPTCIAAHTSMHITPSAGNLYMENNWLWVADHDIEDLNMTRITVYAGRGLLIEASRIWLVGTSVEHHALYQYQLVNASDIWMGQIQTETPYYQPNPPAPFPFTQRSEAYYDPDFDTDCLHNPHNLNYHDGTPTLALAGSPPCAMAWGLRILDSENVIVFGAGLYSFFNNYSTNCSQATAGENCQARIFAIGPTGEGATTPADKARDLSTVEVYNLNTIGTVSMVTRQGADMALWGDNFVNFASTLAVFRF